MGVWKYIFASLILLLSLLGLALYYTPDGNFHLIACDVGQGDAILATYKDMQVLVDGGPDEKVLDCLAKHLPFWDREIELVILTHPQLDHYGGLVEVFNRYKVDTFIKNKVDSGSLSYKVLISEVGGSGASVLNPREGLSIRLGLIHLDILHPSEALQEGGWKDLNDLSIVANLKFGDFEAILTGDISPKEITEIIGQGKIHDVEYLKVPHHGSKNGLTHEFLEAAKPEIAAISVGKKNSYGHPNKETLEMLSVFGVRVYRTDEAGDVEVSTNGKGWWIEN